MKWQEMINNTFGDMYVIRRANKEETPWKSHSIPLLVKCVKCEQEWIARKEDIEKNKQCPYCTVKTGRGHIKNISGQRFGYLTALVYDKIETKNDSNKAHWICRCDCGNIVSVRLQNLLGQNHSYTISCGCKTRSLGELNTQNAIESLGLIYKIEILVPECHKYSPFDIEVINPKNNNRLCFFECDGEQHFKVGVFNQTEEDLIHQQQIDNIKNIWCEENNIPLFRIPYTEYNKINSEYLLNRFPKFKKLLESI